MAAIVLNVAGAPVNVPAWAGVGTIVIGGALLLSGRKQ